jgi:hypothetical protein
MSTLQQQIVEKFLAKLEESKQFNSSKIERLGKLFRESKKPKADDLVKIFSQAPEEDVK